MSNNDYSKIKQIFSTSYVKHGVSFFSDKEINTVEGLII